MADVKTGVDDGYDDVVLVGGLAAGAEVPGTVKTRPGEVALLARVFGVVGGGARSSYRVEQFGWGWGGEVVVVVVGAPALPLVVLANSPDVGL